jgi:hypothetical protein
MGVCGLLLVLGIAVPKSVSYGHNEHIGGYFNPVSATGQPSSATFWPNGNITVMCSSSQDACCDAGSGGANIHWADGIPIQPSPGDVPVNMTIQN